MTLASAQKKWIRQLVLWVVAAGGIFISLAAAYQVYQSARNRLEDAHQKAAAAYILSIQRALTANLEVLYSIKAFYAASREVERDEFRAFLQPALARGLALKSLYWAPRVTAQERTLFEQAAQAEGYSYFHIMELLSPTQRISAAQRPEFFPVYFAEPDEAAPVILGFDLASEPVRLEALIRARDTDALAVTGGIVLLGDVAEPAVLAVAPIYKNRLPHETPEQRKANLQGFAAAAFRIKDIIDYSVNSKPGREIPAIEVIDASATTGEGHILYRSESWPSAEFRTPGWLEDRGKVAVGGRTWLIRCAAPGRLSAKFLLMIAGVFCLGLLVTFLVVAYLYVVLSRSAKIEQAVISRTEVLSRLNQELSKNIAERERAEKERRDSEERYTRLIQDAPDPIVSLSLTGIVESMNPAAEKAVGYTAQELLGKHFATLAILQGPSRRKALREFVLVASGRRRTPFELELVRKDGSTLIFEVNPNLMKQSGQGVGIQVIFREVTHRKEMEHALVLREEELKEKTSALEASLKELAYREKIMHSLLDDLQETNRRLALQQQSLQQVHYSLEKSHEELKATQLQLIQAAKLESVGRLAAGVAHEVKNPLAIILMGATYLAKHIGADDGAQAAVLKDMTDAVKRADGVIKGLLEFSSSKELDVHPEDVHAVIEKSLTLVKYELTKARIEVRNAFADNLPKVSLDHTKMEQVLINLFTNAAHAMPSGGTLTVRTGLRLLNRVGPGIGQRKDDMFRVGEEAVEIHVEDTGSGIPADKLSKVFDPFFTTKAPGQGTGLGLSVAKSIIDMHRGVIQISNRPEGGARVTILLRPVPR